MGGSRGKATGRSRLERVSALPLSQGMRANCRFILLMPFPATKTMIATSLKQSAVAQSKIPYSIHLGEKINNYI